MPGLLLHTIAAIISLIIVHRLHFKWEYSWSIFAGNFIPDVFKFGLSAIKQGTFAIFYVKQDSFFSAVDEFTYSIANWFTLGFFIMGLLLVLYHFHYIKKKKMEEYDELFVFFIIGIIIHIVMDYFIIESTPWI